jgi:hybrid cluster-associated redox disulfide protein
MISKDMKIADVMARFPETVEIFTAFGLDCRDCQIAEYEEIEHGASVHNVDIDELLSALNHVISK